MRDVYLTEGRITPESTLVAPRSAWPRTDDDDDAMGHINEREAVAALIALEEARSTTLLITDSRVVEAALQNGRSRNVVINAVVAYIIEKGELVGVAWIPSAENPADAPSRGRAPDLQHLDAAVPASASRIFYNARQ